MEAAWSIRNFSKTAYANKVPTREKKINTTSTINHGQSLRLTAIGFSKRSLLKEVVLCIIVIEALNAVKLFSRSVDDIMHFTGM